MDTNETCISYFARVYGIDFTETENGMKDEEFCALEDALQEEITSAAEDLKSKPELAQDRLIAYTAACRKTIGRFLSECASVVNGDAYQREPLTGTCSKSGKPMTQAWVMFGTSSDCLDMLDSTEIKTSVLNGRGTSGTDSSPASVSLLSCAPHKRLTLRGELWLSFILFLTLSLSVTMRRPVHGIGPRIRRTS